ncbi:MAG: DUF417 family protein [Emcibacteraceae bacterium]|nr:DUF417 family protein [Emcibacteraceae bacterium]
MNIFNQSVAIEYANKLDNIGINAIRLTLITVLTWIGLMKFTAYEAGAIEGLVASSPLVGWLYSVFSVQMTSNLIGSIEIATAAALLIGFKNHRIGLLGAAAAAFTFLLTSSFLISAPVWEASLGGFPALSVVPGQFLLKDIVLLSSALVLIGESFKGIASNNS